MKTMLRMLDFLTWLLFVLAALLVGLILLVVAYDMASRNFGLPTAMWAVNSVEYAMLHITFLALPWLVRTRGHVSVEVLLMALPPRLRHMHEVFLHILAAAVCFYIAWRSGMAFVQAVVSGSYEVRTFDTPMWILFATMPLGTFFGGLQFLSFLPRSESYFVADKSTGAGL